MILLDTSAVVALAADNDPEHARAIAHMERAGRDGEELLVHSYIVVETVAVLQRRLGNEAVLAFLDEVPRFVLHWITREDHEDAVALFRERARRRLSLVDCASFVVMRRYGITQAFTFDGDFEREGFALYGS